MKKNILLVFLGTFFTAYLVSGQGVTRYGNVATSSPEYVDSKGQRLPTGSLTVWGEILPPGFNCGADLTIHHLISDGVAPVDKTITYGTISTKLFGNSKCVITKNLGADSQPVSGTDTSKAAAGWYWQFNRKQGYMHDGTTRTPNNPWIYPINESSDWLSANDPCAQELGAGWRIPTNSEWIYLDNSSGWWNYNSAFDSELKLHSAGQLSFGYGILTGRGEACHYWSSNQIGDDMAWSVGALSFTFTASIAYYKSVAYSLRCIKDCTSPSAPTGRSSQFFYHEQTLSDLKVKGTAIKWYNSLQGGSVLPDSTRLVDGNHYFASQTVGSCESSDRLDVKANLFHCGTPLTVTHSTDDGVVPENVEITYNTQNTTLFGGHKCVITQNLGAEDQAISPADTTQDAAGWYWQFNRKQGYKHDGILRIPTSTWNADSDNLSPEWETAKDPCAIELGEGWRIPSFAEWSLADAGWANAADAYNSGLNIHAAGRLNAADGSLDLPGNSGFVWSSSGSNPENAWSLVISSISSVVDTSLKANAYSVRCIRACTPPPAPTGELSQIYYQGHTLAELTVNGTSINWYDAATGGNWLPSTTLLTDSTHYFATQTVNECESIGRLEVFAIKSPCIATSLTINHLAAEGVAPVDKTVTYGLTATALFGGGYKCIITQNLGASNPPASESDNSEAAAGWYWQFNRKQGYKLDTTTRTPATTWITSINENNDWLPENDPCALELGPGWRMPTGYEWSNVVNSTGWTTINEIFASELTLHLAGFLSRYDGSLQHRGNVGALWSSTNAGSDLGDYLHFSPDYFSYFYFGVIRTYKIEGCPVRCIKEKAN